MTAPVPAPYSIKVDRHDCGDDHHQVTIEPALVVELCPDHGYSDIEVITGFRWVAGIAARAAVALMRDFDEEKRAHGCVTSDWGGCSVAGSDVLADPAADLLDAPGVWIAIPDKVGKKWQTKVQKMVQQIVAAEANAATQTPAEPASTRQPHRHPVVAAQTPTAIPQLPSQGQVCSRCGYPDSTNGHSDKCTTAAHTPPPPPPEGQRMSEDVARRHTGHPIADLGRSIDLGHGSRAVLAVAEDGTEYLWIMRRDGDTDPGCAAPCCAPHEQATPLPALYRHRLHTCAGLTAIGEPCRISVASMGGRCRHHRQQTSTRTEESTT
jgi:hypothetical protein